MLTMYFQDKSSKREMHALQYEKKFEYKLNNNALLAPLNKPDY